MTDPCRQIRRNKIGIILILIGANTILNIFLRFCPSLPKWILNFLYNVSHLFVDNPFNLGFFLSKKNASYQVKRCFMFNASSTRLNKYISESGICSRRDADRFVEQGNVYINGKRAQVGDQVVAGDTVKVNGQLIEPREADDFVFIVLNKPWVL